jgi:mandelate racemase
MTDQNLTIKSITATPVLAPLARPIVTAVGVIPSAPLVLIDVLCSTGITGRAYIFGYTPVSLKPIVETIANLSDILVGQPVVPFKRKQQLDKAFRLLGRQGFLGMAMGGLDMAFWDALGQTANLSVARLLGGAETAINCYDSHGVFHRKTTPAHLERSLAMGFKAVKVKIGGGSLQTDIDAVKAVREIIGTDVLLMLDYNQSLSAPEAIHRISHLEPFDIHWIEEPVPAEDFAGHCRVRAASNIAIQSGENWWFPEDAARAVAAGIADHAMIDIMKIGGITGWLEAAGIANGAALPISSHLFIEATAQVMAVTPGAHLLEYLDIAGAMLETPYEINHGTLCPRGPGIGINWNKAAVEKYAL